MRSAQWEQHLDRENFQAWTRKPLSLLHDDDGYIQLHLQRTWPDVLVKMSDFLSKDASPSAILVAADVGFVLLVHKCSHVHSRTVTSLRPLQIQEREKFHWTPHHSSFTRHPLGPFCLGRLFTNLQWPRMGHVPHISSNSSVSSIKDGLPRYLNYYHSIMSGSIAP